MIIERGEDHETGVSLSRFCAVVVMFVLGPVAIAQAADEEAAESISALPLTRVQDADAVVLDGVLDESIWERLPAMDSMQVINPDTLQPASLETQSRIFYNDRGIYVGVMNYQNPGTLVARMSSRDNFLERDGYVISIDPSGDGRYGYFLRINLGGTMTDGTILPEKQINRDWDGPWQAFTAENEAGWTAEIFIPWSMMALPAETGPVRRIGLYMERDVAHLGETWSWPALPNTANTYLSAFQPFEVRDVDPARQLFYYPFASATFDDIKDETEYKVGTDLYWRPTGNTQLSATLNPDFGTVESDDVVVNLGAFETFFSEKRPFFLEGQDVFITSPRDSGGPFGPTTLLNTRRIGGQAVYDVPDDVEVVSTDLSSPTDLLGAAKFTGQAGNLRYGTLLAAEDDSEIRGFTPTGERTTLEADGRDFAVARLLYEDTSFGGRRSIGWLGTLASHPEREAIVNGIDLHYFSPDARWIFDGQLMVSDVEGVTGSGGFFDLSYRPDRGVQHSITGTYLDDKLEINDLGYVQRNDHVQLDYRLSIEESDLENFRSRRRSMNVINQWNTAGRPVRLGLFFGQDMTFHDNSELGLNFRYFPPRVDDSLSRGNGIFKVPMRLSGRVDWESDPSNPLSVELGLNAEEGELGELSVESEAGLRWRPADTFAVSLSLSYTDTEALLIHQGDGRLTSFDASEWSPELSLDYFLSSKQQLRFSMQWTGIKATEDRFFQIDQDEVDYPVEIAKPTPDPEDFVISRLSFQARYRWEIAPLSDLFFVYSRGGNVPPASFGPGRSNPQPDSYGRLLQRAWTSEVADTWTLKLRYRFDG